ncbi:site-specific integrase [Williamsia serinedens]
MPRRAPGDGGLHQRKSDGMWIASVTLPDGSKYQRGRKKYDDAVEQLRKMRRDLDDGVSLKTSSVTVNDWLDHWLPEVAQPRLKPSTYATYRSAVKNHIRPHLGRKKIEQLTPADIRGMSNKIARTHSTRTSQAVFNILSKALKDAVRNGTVRSNVCDRVDRPQVRSREREPLTVAQARALLRYLLKQGDPAQTARWTVSLLTGARQAECLGLTWDRVDLDRGLIDISYSLARLKLKPGPRPRTEVYPRDAFDVPPTFDFHPVWRTACLVAPKTARSRRVVPLLPPAVAVLRQMGPGSGLVWTRDDGSPVLPRDDTAAWKQTCVAAGIAASVDTAPDQHVGRHTVATLLQEAGVDEATRMQILGHSSVAAHRGYAHVNTDLTRAALGSLSDLLQLSSGPDPL